ncbi:MAG: thioredoxin family protein [Ichthyobacteriaceae bacterium]|nr:thioredoxin family protein [Ichthyobacteriaceae bacterium]
MTKKDLVISAIKLEETPRVPWIPFVGCHAGSLLGITATEFLRSKDHIVKGVNQAIELYSADGMPVIFDLQIEAEAMGCKLNWADDNPPAVVSHPMAEGVALEDIKMPTIEDGRIKMAMETTKQLRADNPDIALYGLITGPFTLALHLLGTDIFMKLMLEPDYVHDLMKFTTKVCNFMATEYVKAGADIVAIVDPMTSQIDPMSFEEFVQPYAAEVFETIKNEGALSSFFVCGNAKQNIEAMCNCKPDNISIDENISLEYVRDVSLNKGVSFGGNIQLTVSLLMGTEEECQRDALACMDTGGKKGFLLAPGCDIPMDTPVHNMKAIADLVKDEMRQGELRASEVATKEVDKLDLTAHWKSDKVRVDVVTLNSKSCAACQYMFKAAEVVSEPFGDDVICKEYNIMTEEGVQMMQTLGVRNLPTIVIDGKVEFVSQIPPLDEITKKIEAQLAKKKQLV